MADDSHKVSYLIFFENWKISQNLSAAVVIGALRVKARPPTYQQFWETVKPSGWR